MAKEKEPKLDTVETSSGSEPVSNPPETPLSAPVFEKQRVQLQNGNFKEFYVQVQRREFRDPDDA